MYSRYTGNIQYTIVPLLVVPYDTRYTRIAICCDAMIGKSETYEYSYGNTVQNPAYYLFALAYSNTKDYLKNFFALGYGNSRYSSLYESIYSSRTSTEIIKAALIMGFLYPRQRLGTLLARPGHLRAVQFLFVSAGIQRFGLL